MADKIKYPETVTVKNKGIRHRVLHPVSGLISIEEGEEKAVPGAVAFGLLVDTDDFELVAADGDKKAFADAVDAEKKANRKASEAREKIRAKEEKEALEADARTARSRQDV